MINKIIDGMSVAINAEFGDDYEIYAEKTEQGLKEPCFSILCINPTNEHFKNNKYHRTNQFCVHYFPSSDEARSECNMVIERLYGCLEQITIIEDNANTLTSGSRMNGEVVNNVLNFFVNYNMFVTKSEVSPENMETYEINTDAKG